MFVAEPCGRGLDGPIWHFACATPRDVWQARQALERHRDTGLIEHPRRPDGGAGSVATYIRGQRTGPIYPGFAQALVGLSEGLGVLARQTWN